MNPRIKTIELSTGVTLPYDEQGDPSGVPVVLLHGYTDSLHSFDLLSPHLPASLHAYALTQRGHGDADRPAAGYRPEDYAADVLAFMDAVGLDAAVIAGHSGGSYTAQRFALDYPDRTLGIVLIGSFRSFDDNPAVLEFWDAVSQLADPVDPEFVREFQESCVAQPVPAGFFETIVAESRKVPARVWKSYLRGFMDAEVPTEAGTVAAPTLVLWGDEDAFCPRSQQDALLAAIPAAQLVTYRGTGHCPHWEQPELTAARVAAFAGRVDRAARAATASAA